MPITPDNENPNKTDELVVTLIMEVEALASLLIEKGMLTRAEFHGKVNQLKEQRNR